MTQVAVKLPDDLVHEIDQLVSQGYFPSRSSVIRRGLESVVRAHRARVIDEAYAQGYAAIPETEEEIAEATRGAVAAINDEVWERWW